MLALTCSKVLLADARRGGYAVSYCESWNLESLQAVLEAAVELESPIIAGFSGRFLRDPGREKAEDLRFYAGLRQAIDGCPVPASFLLNESESVEQMREAIDLGFNSLMIENEGLHRLVCLVKNLDEGCSGWFQIEGCAVQNPHNLRSDRGVAGFDLTHVFTSNFSYELPFGKGRPLQTRNWVADYIISPGQFKGIVELTSGQKYTMNITGDIANTQDSGYRAGYERRNQIGDPSLANPDPNVSWFNTAAIARPAVYTFGSLSRNTMRSDWIRHADISLFRIFPIRERSRVEFRAEAYNITNAPVFSVPTSDLSNADFGKITSTRLSPRQLQLGLKVVF